MIAATATGAKALHTCRALVRPCNEPEPLAVQGFGLVVSVVPDEPSHLIVIVPLAAKKVPATVTVVPVSPDVGDSVIEGLTVSDAVPLLLPCVESPA